MNLSELCHHVSLGRWKLAGTSFGVPLQGSIGDGTTLFDVLLSSNGFYEGFATNFFPSINKSVIKPTSQIVVLQNLPANLVCPQNIDSKILQALGLNRNVFNRNPYSVLEFFSEKYYPCDKTITKLCYSTDKLRTDTPFPSILAGDNESRQPLTNFSTLYTSPCFYELLHKVTIAIKKMNLHKFHIVQEFGFDKDMVSELLEDLTQIAQTYDQQRTFDELHEE